MRHQMKFFRPYNITYAFCDKSRVVCNSIYSIGWSIEIRKRGWAKEGLNILFFTTVTDRNDFRILQHPFQLQMSYCRKNFWKTTKADGCGGGAQQKMYYINDRITFFLSNRSRLISFLRSFFAFDKLQKLGQLIYKEGYTERKDLDTLKNLCLILKDFSCCSVGNFLLILI